MNLNYLDTASPVKNATVHASAGTGKTWLLVTRIINLLIYNVDPKYIIALTFTRKAAAEMQERLYIRARFMATTSDKELLQHLKEIGIDTTSDNVQRARNIYERLLHAQFPVRITTFHAFCQEILLRFPLEANLPPEFELLETTSALELEAWQALYQQLRMSTNTELGDALEFLFNKLDSLSSTSELVMKFIGSRIDWWAYTHGENDPVTYAVNRLAKKLQVKPDQVESEEQQISLFLSDLILDQFSALGKFLKRHNKSYEKKQIEQISLILNANQALSLRLSACQKTLYTLKGDPRNISTALLKSIGPQDEHKFEQLFATLCNCYQDFSQELKRVNVYRLSHAWLTVGNQLLTHYQTLKRQRRYLDYADLEWKTCELLNHGENAMWIQYKLDQRIDHLLVDEFQDTNPSQWTMLSPLLEELASTQTERLRSVFLVGDEKQSIYGFRRANSELFKNASNWLTDNLAAIKADLSMSRRSSPAILDAVNRVFTGAELISAFTDFREHHSFDPDLWGKVTLLPLATRETVNLETVAFRNPMEQPRLGPTKTHLDKEAEQIATTIKQMLDQALTIKIDGDIRPIQYSDIIILLRKRTNVSHFERALSRHQIPFLSADRGTFLQCLEIQDLCALIEVIISPHNNLKLAQVLKSPLYNVSENDLLKLSYFNNEKVDDHPHASNNWYQRLEYLAADIRQTDPESPLCRAWQQLESWREQSGSLPVHDLLDKIYHDTNILNRYQKAFPASLTQRLHANFSYFIDMALELDSGRYPSLHYFSYYLKSLYHSNNDAPDLPPSDEVPNRVTVMTIHASKGLEASVVFIADSTNDRTRSHSHEIIVHWPADKSKPTDFFIAHRNDINVPWIETLHQQHKMAESREQLNLLYVAMTRARQYLFLSGTLPAKGKNLGWYGFVKEKLGKEKTESNESICIEHGKALPANQKFHAALENQEKPNAAEIEMLANMIEITTQSEAHKPNPVTPSSENTETIEDDDSQTRGTSIHRILELLTQDPSLTLNNIILLLSRDKVLCQDDDEIEVFYNEVGAVLKNDKLKHFFDYTKYERALNEVPIQYHINNNLITGIIDRLVFCKETIHLIDYKTHRTTESDLKTYSEKFKSQIGLYQKGISLLYPNKLIRSYIIYTYTKELIEFKNQ